MILIPRGHRATSQRASPSRFGIAFVSSLLCSVPCESRCADLAMPKPLPNYPGNTRTLRNIRLEDYPEALFKRPIGRETITLACPCGHTFEPSWTEQLKFEHTPVQSADGARWALAGLQLPCLVCSQLNELRFPTVEEQQAPITLFGDEAFEWMGSKSGFLYVIAFTEDLTRQGFPVDFVLEAETNAHETNYIDYTLERVGRSLRHNLAYLYYSRCQFIGLPMSQPKSARAELELADLVAYMVRRYFHCGNINRATEFPLDLLGRIFWGAFTPDRFGTRTATGFPWEYFYPGFQHPMRFEQEDESGANPRGS
jgi:hypothetical protein